MDHRPLNHKVFYIQFVSDGGVKKMLKFDYTICGYEKLYTPVTESMDYWYKKTAIDQNRTIEWNTLDPLFWFDLGGSAQGCFNETLVFYTDKYCITEWLNPTPKWVELQSDGNGKQRIYQYTNVSYPYTELWLCRKSLGNSYAAVPMAFEVCGTQTVSLAPSVKASSYRTLNLTYNQNQCPRSQCVVELGSYKSNFSSSSRLCQANDFKVYTLNANGQRIEFTGSEVTVNAITGEIIIKTHYPYNKKLYLGAVNAASTEYLDLNVTVVGSK